jgi:RNA:NAD 2'-phosphotransferase (TPT1/KptA family)
MSKSLTSTSKFLSLVLRYKPEEIGLHLNEEV